MKNRILKSAAVLVLAFGLVTSVRAADEKEKTITGEGKCAKCALKETSSCQNAVQVKDKDTGKTVTYYLTQNDVSKKFHEQLCKGTKKVKVTGKVKTVEGKHELTPTKIELAKDDKES